MRNVVTRFTDEHSMTVRTYCACIKNRNKELKIPTNVLDEEHNTILIDEVYLDQ